MSGGHDAALSVMGHIRYPIILRMWNIRSATLQEEFGGIREGAEKAYTTAV